jgi:hypothetical protein
MRISSIRPGETGIDITYVSGPRPFFGDHAEIKPCSPSGQRKFETQKLNWGLPNANPITYDKDGNIYDGFYFP